MGIPGWVFLGCVLAPNTIANTDKPAITFLNTNSYQPIHNSRNNKKYQLTTWKPRENTIRTHTTFGPTNLQRMPLYFKKDWIPTERTAAPSVFKTQHSKYLKKTTKSDN